jgi:hypothetical protein
MSGSTGGKIFFLFQDGVSLKLKNNAKHHGAKPVFII